MRKSAQYGFSLVSAIFLLVVVAALGAFAVTLSTTQHQSQAMEIMGARAYQAALAGVEWAAFNVANGPAPWAGCALGSPVVAGGNLAGFTIVVNCVATPAVEGAAAVNIYNVVSVATLTGSVPGDINYVQQVATAKLGSCTGC
ncbi:MAG: hypothetical protein ABI479_07555 [Gallionella sp.]